MDQSEATRIAKDAHPAGDARWRASLSLGYAHRDGATVPVRRVHEGPLRIQRGFLPEGPQTWHQVVVHPPGGVASGDALSIEIDAQAGAHVLLTSPGAAKWYRARPPRADRPIDSLEARQTVRIQVRENACVEWLPLENIVFDGASASWRTRVDLAAGAAWIGAELVCLGRPASEERFERGALRWRTEIHRDGRLLFHEQALLRGGDRLLESPAGLGGAPAYGSLLAVAPRALAEDAALLAALRAIDAPGEIAVTALPDLVAVRWRGAQAQEGWRALRAAWALLRPEVCGRVACSPRIWNT